MKFITIIYVLFSCATILAASDKNYCDTYLSNRTYGTPLYGEKWKINNDGTLKMIDKTPTPTINEGTLNALVYSYSEKGNVVVINSAQGNFRGPTDKEQIVFKLDSNKKILSMQFGTHQYEDSYRYHRTILFDNKNGICYPQLALEGALDINPVTKSYDDNSPIDGIINNSIYFNTELCRDLNAYINNEKNKDTVMKCSCGTSQSNKILTDIINKHNKIKISGKDYSFEGKPKFYTDGIFDTEMIQKFVDLTPTTQALSILKDCNIRGVIETISDDDLWKEAPTKETPNKGSATAGG